MVILKSSLLKLLTGVLSGYIEVITYNCLQGCLMVTLKSSLLNLFTRAPSGYIEIITSKAVKKGV